MRGEISSFACRERQIQWVSQSNDSAMMSILIRSAKKYMQSLAQRAVNCPYCGEAIDVLIDDQDAGDQYIEDCQVCCRPITFTVSVDSAGHLSVSVRDENDA